MTPARVLAALLEDVRTRVEKRVAELSADDPTAHEPLRGLYVSPEAVDRLLRLPGPDPDGPPFSEHRIGAPSPTGHARLDALCVSFGLSQLDCEFLLLALAPDLDRRFGPLYGYLNDDVGRRRATVGLALDLCGRSSLSAPDRARLAAGAPLVAGRLITLEAAERPWLERELLVPDRVCGHLLGDDGLDPELTAAAVLLPAPGVAAGAASRPAAALRARPARPLHLRCPRGDDPVAAALRACAGLERPVLSLDPARFGDDPGVLLGTALREARLREAVLLLGPLPSGAEERWVRAAVEPAPTEGAGAGAVPVVLFGSAPFDPSWTDVPLLALATERELRDGAQTWREALGEAAAGTGAADPSLDVAAEAGAYRMTDAQIRQAARDAVDLAEVDGAALSAAHLHEAARLRNGTGLDRYARRVRPAVGLSDLVLPPEPLLHVEELVHRARHRQQVLRSWGMRRGGGRGSGVVAVFTGESGTGKTMAAEVVAGALGLDLYVVELSSVVDKYVGETEKNLDRIFTQADAVNAVLLFDEADAVFGKRSDVKDSHDRYANLESAYLLQRLESFDGVAILTTNLRGNIDEAFTRRFDVMVEFPAPDEERRRALWEHCLRPPLPCAEDIDVASLARDFELAGGSIRAAAVTAAYLASAAGRPVGAAEVREGARREYAKAGRLLPER